MARQPRFEYPDAVYHVMARGDGGKTIFEGKEDHQSFLYWLERVCTSHDWRVHAWVLIVQNDRQTVESHLSLQVHPKPLPPEDRRSAPPNMPLAADHVSC
jgi:putative transposase